MKIAVIGAGISGLTIGRLLSKKNEVTIFEEASQVGGIAWTKMIDNVPYHLVGGHCMNLKNPMVADFIFNTLPKDKWHSVERVAKIAFKGHFVNYPIEFSVPEIAKFDEDLAFRITRDFLSSNDFEVSNLDQWFRAKFGNTLAEEYLIPYNRKIWGMSPSDMSPEWVDGKLPVPDRKQFFRSLMRREKDSMPHAVFYYPNNDEPNELLQCMASGLNIKLGYGVESLEKVNNRWNINGEGEFDLVVSTMPLKVLPSVIVNTPSDILSASNLLKYNKITNMLWETDEVDATWTYFPEDTTIFHRHIHIGNFLKEKKNFTITEALGERSRKTMEEEGRKIAYLRRPIDYNVSDFAYVVYDHNYQSSVSKIKDHLSDIGVFTLGRFGEWEYYNMDVCIESAFRLADEINDLVQ